MTTLSRRLRAAIGQIDVGAAPMRVADGARLLAEVQEWEARGASLEQRVALWEDSEAEAEDADLGKSLADRAFEVLRDTGTAMRYREIAAAIKSRGFRHSREPKNPEKQLSDSVWTAMHEDDRFVKVGRGVFDLVERVGSA